MSFLKRLNLVNGLIPMPVHYIVLAPKNAFEYLTALNLMLKLRINRFRHQFMALEYGDWMNMLHNEIDN
jgi:hypothetical protein